MCVRLKMKVRPGVLRALERHASYPKSGYNLPLIEVVLNIEGKNLEKGILKGRWKDHGGLSRYGGSWNR